MSQPRRPSPPIPLTIRLYPGPDDDLIGWLDKVSQWRHGAKSQAVKETLRRGLAADPSLTIAATPEPSLAEIRQVVEAVLTSILDRFGCTFQGETTLESTAEAVTEGCDEADGALEAFGRSLVLGEDRNDYG